MKALKFIDSHIHFWDVRNGFNEWVEETALPGYVTPQHFSANGYVHIEAHGETHSSSCELNWLKSQFPQSNIKLIAFIDFNLPMDQFAHELSLLSAQPDIVGVRQIMASSTRFGYSPFQSEIPKDLSQKLELLAACNMIFEAQMYPGQFFKVLDAISASSVTMAIEHMGLPVISCTKNQRDWLSLVKAISHQSNWFLKLTGFDMLNKGERVTSTLDVIFETIAVSQLCYGSNYPVSHPNHYDSWFNTLREYLADEVIEKDVFYNTAKLLYFKKRSLGYRDST
ncbi:amidohydrolase family protein [Alteromonas ponticola]|uniref:Amidohydrolase family protein n=1 Tax=Alteromonas aquimaris TaxID=2998417 RepID=A0ABT3P383_9ALTE|nr:amidohydrolase family protein [Alteromonas aquimaris]MCW8107215.1 amidohydrolase family protein [Alteromonas aquimaris]